MNDPLVIFENRLKSFDWDYEFTDDAEVYRLRRDDHKQLIKEAKAGGLPYLKLLAKYEDETPSSF